MVEKEELPGITGEREGGQLWGTPTEGFSGKREKEEGKKCWRGKAIWMFWT